MLKPLQTACLAGTGLLAIGAFLLACAGDQISARRPEVTTSAASVPSKPGPSKSIDVNRPVEAPVPFLVAMQESPTSSQHGVQRLPVSNVGWIGLVLEDKNGVRVGAVFPGGPAAFAGVRVGDMLMRVGGTNVESMQVASAAIERLVPQQQTSLTIQHGGKTVELKVTPDSYAEFQQNYIAEMMRRDPRDPKYGQQHGVSSADMQVELVRRLFQQNERLDRTLLEVLKEVNALRKQVAGLQK